MLDIDSEKVTKDIQKYIRSLMKEKKNSHIILGLSGGIDSAVLAVLAVGAVGADMVRAYYLKDRDSEKESQEKAQLLADWLGFKLEVQDISHVMKEDGIYSPLIMRISTIAHFINRMIQRSYCLFFNETPHKSTLKEGCGEFEHNPFKRLVFDLSVHHLEKGFNARHIHRRKVIEQIAQENNYLILGAANRSESMVGWFVKDGIDDMPIQPLLGLYKTQVWQLADYLNLPSKVRNQKPSPDMMKGITDEFAIGIEYRRLDEILDYLERGLDESEIIALGISAKELKNVIDIHRLSAFKRESEHVKPPLEGITGSPYRVD